MLKGLIENKIKEIVATEYHVKDFNPQVDYPTNEKWGDYTTNTALILSKIVKQNPQEIAKKICYEMSAFRYKGETDKNEYTLFSKVETAGSGFINMTLSSEWVNSVSQRAVAQEDTYGSSQLGNKKRIIVEYSSPNPNKQLHIGQSRNNFLGYSLAKILEFVGYESLKINYINNMGVHICKSMLMYQKYGQGKEPDKKPDKFVGEFYIMFEKEAEKTPSLKEEAAEMFRKWEAGDKEVRALWEKMVAWAFEGWRQTYENEKVAFDVWQYQSDYLETGKEIAQIALKNGVAEKDETGAIIARLKKYNIPDKVLLRSDGTSIYSTQDMQLAKDSYEKYKFAKRLYVVDHRQADYFRQVFMILKILGFEWASDLHHIAYGEVRLKDGPMSSRLGKVVFSDDVFETLVKLEGEEIKSRNQGNSVTEDVIKQVALAAFKYAMLKIDSAKDFIFDYSAVTKFEGDTGPYVLYTHARACSVLAKADFPEKWDMGVLSEEELQLLKLIGKFDEVVAKAAEEFSPSVICNYLFDVCQKFNSFYNSSPILNAESEDVKNARLVLCKCTAIVVKNGLSLLGLLAPSHM